MFKLELFFCFFTSTPPSIIEIFYMIFTPQKSARWLSSIMVWGKNMPNNPHQKYKKYRVIEMSIYKAHSSISGISEPKKSHVSSVPHIDNFCNILSISGTHSPGITLLIEKTKAFQRFIQIFPRKCCIENSLHGSQVTIFLFY